MKNSSRTAQTDLEECKQKLNSLLREYNCYLMSADEWSNVLLIDNDTDETTSAQEK